MRSPKNRLSMLYCAQTCRSSVGICWTMSSAVAQRIYLAWLACASGMPAGADVLLKEFDRVGDLLHQARERGLHQRDAQPPQAAATADRRARMMGLAFGATNSSKCRSAARSVEAGITGSLNCCGREVGDEIQSSADCGAEAGAAHAGRRRRRTG